MRKNNDYKKEYSITGSIFLDYRNSIDLDRKLLIYGHNSKDKDKYISKYLEALTNK